MRSRRVKALLKALLVGVLSLSGSALNAHSTSTAYLEVDTSSRAALTLQWRIALRDLDA